MSIFHDEVEIEDFDYDEETETYSYPCPCGDIFTITKVSIGTSSYQFITWYSSLLLLQHVLLLFPCRYKDENDSS
jgi:hypothetical protein